MADAVFDKLTASILIAEQTAIVRGAARVGGDFACEGFSVGKAIAMIAGNLMVGQEVTPCDCQFCGEVKAHGLRLYGTVNPTWKVGYAFGDKLVVYDRGPEERYGLGQNDSNLSAFIPISGRFSVRLNGLDFPERSW
jgi:hypothetical protein